jgi:urea transport system ATP-binding protein
LIYALVTRPQLLVLDEPTEGIQPSIIKEIGRAIEYLRSKGAMAIVLVEQYFEFARDLADDFAVMDRGSIIMAGDKSMMVEKDVRSRMSI